MRWRPSCRRRGQARVREEGSNDAACEYGYIQQVKPDQYGRIRSAAGVEPVVVKPCGWATVALNTKQGLRAGPVHALLERLAREAVGPPLRTTATQA